jgi:hypothetical protein
MVLGNRVISTAVGFMPATCGGEGFGIVGGALQDTHWKVCGKADLHSYPEFLIIPNGLCDLRERAAKPRPQSFHTRSNRRLIG